jgi:hypothetical protein
MIIVMTEKIFKFILGSETGKGIEAIYLLLLKSWD